MAGGDLPWEFGSEFGKWPSISSIQVGMNLPGTKRNLVNDRIGIVTTRSLT